MKYHNKKKKKKKKKNKKHCLDFYIFMYFSFFYCFFSILFFFFFFFFFFFNDTATTEIYTLSLHDALPIFLARYAGCDARPVDPLGGLQPPALRAVPPASLHKEGGVKVFYPTG